MVAYAPTETSSSSKDIDAKWSELDILTQLPTSITCLFFMYANAMTLVGIEIEGGRIPGDTTFEPEIIAVLYFYNEQVTTGFHKAVIRFFTLREGTLRTFSDIADWSTGNGAP